MSASAPIDTHARAHTDGDTTVDVASASQAAELVRHPGHAARTQARWSDWRAAAERVHAAVRPRFVTTVLLLGGLMALLATLAVALSWPAR
jgi:hypothetical protein